LKITPHDERTVLFEACREYREQLTAARTALVEAMNEFAQCFRDRGFETIKFPEHWTAALGEQKKDLKL